MINLLTILLACLSLFYFYLFDRYEITGTVLAPDFASADVLSISVEGAHLHNLDAAKNRQIHFSQGLPVRVTKDRLIWLEGEFSLDKVSDAKKGWHGAKVYLMWRSEGGKWRWLPGGLLFNDVGTRSHFTESKVIEVPTFVAEVRLSIQLARVSGELTIHKLSIHTVEESLLSKGFKIGLVLGWVLLVIRLLFLLRGNTSIAVVGVMFILSSLLLMPQSLKMDVIGYLDAGVDGLVGLVGLVGSVGTVGSAGAVEPVGVVGSAGTVEPVGVVKPAGLVKPTGVVKPAQSASVKQAVKKPRRLMSAFLKDVGIPRHLILFLLTTGFVLFATARLSISKQLAISPGKIIACLLLYAGVTEVLQHFSPGRTPDWADFGMNCLGIGLAYVLYLSWGCLGKLRGSE